MSDTVLIRVKAALLALGWDTIDLADALRVHRSTLSAQLHGRRRGLDVGGIARVLGIDAARLKPGGPCPWCGREEQT